MTVMEQTDPTSLGHGLDFGLVTTEEELQALAEALLKDGTRVCFDIETGYLGPDREKAALDIDSPDQFICGFSISNHPSWARYIPVAHDLGPNLENAWTIIKPVLETLPILSHNAIFEARNLLALEWKGRGPKIHLNIADDSMLGSYSLAESPVGHGLKALSKYHLGYEQAEITSLFPGITKKAEKALRFNTLDVTDPAVLAYVCDDAVRPEQIMRIIEARFEVPDPADPYAIRRKWIYQMELEVAQTLIAMTEDGHAVDWEAIEEYYGLTVGFEEHMKDSARALLLRQWEQSLDEVTQAYLGEETPDEETKLQVSQVQETREFFQNLNLASTPQMRRALYDYLGLDTTRLTDKGEKSTDETALNRLAQEHGAIQRVLEVRQVANLKARLKKWSQQYHTAHDDRVHASFNQVVVAAGRFSANDPAIQQLPKEFAWHSLDPVLAKRAGIDMSEQACLDALAEEPRILHGAHYLAGNFRDFMIAAPESYLLVFDWSQVELRMLAGIAGESVLIEAFNEGRDIHVATAAMMFGLSEDQVTPKYRARGKTINFGLVYQMGEGLLADSLAISLGEAEDLMETYFQTFPHVKTWFAEAKYLGASYHYSQTYFGRRVPIPEYDSPYFGVRSKAERLAVNVVCQGSAADYAKISMLRCVKALKERGWWRTHVRMINNLHDALTFEVNGDVDPNELRELLIPCVTWTIPSSPLSWWGSKDFPAMEVDWEIGTRWGSLTKWKDEAVIDLSTILESEKKAS